MNRIFLLAMALLLASPAVVAAQSARDRFLAADIFGGVLPAGIGKSGEDSTAGPWDIDGWEVGATIRFRPWLGADVSGGRHTMDGVRTHHLLAGPRIATRYLDPWAVRFFAHALVGFGNASVTSGSSESGAEMAAGAGFDLFGVIRMKFDYVRLAAGSKPLQSGRAFIGGVVPLCFRGCSEADGFDVSGRARR